MQIEMWIIIIGKYELSVGIITNAYQSKWFPSSPLTKKEVKTIQIIYTNQCI